MRITNNMIMQSQFDAMQTNINALNRASQVATTGKRILQASDDPNASTQVMASNTTLRALDQYKTNVQRAASRVDTEDGVLSQIGDLITRAKEIGLQQGGDTASAATRQTANAELQQIFGQIVSLGNTKFGDEYLFGGDQATTAPFTSSGSGAGLTYTATNSTGTRTTQIGAGQSMEVAHDGKELLVDTGILDAVKKLSAALDQSSPTYGTVGISDALSSLDSSFDSLQTLVGDVGARAKALDSASENITAYKTNVTTFKSDLEEVDIETAVTELTQRQTAYQAAMLSTSKVMSLTLTDYLR
jgi:flagellar hook-associated protein 3 FlgL